MSQKGDAKLHFLRFEFKYVLPQQQRAEIEAELRHFVELDPYVADQPGQQYFVRSLYFDDPTLSSFHEKQDGQHTRSKFRIRTYARTVDSDTPWFLEIKGRYNNLVFKHRAPIRPPFDRRLRGDALVAMILQRCAPGPVRDQFAYERFRKQIAPVALIDYLRRPYVSKFDPEFRLTFDCELAASESDAMFPPHPRLRQLLPGRTVMEVKFRHHVPSWFHRIIQAWELRRRSISKICTGIEALGLQLDPS